MKMIPLPRTIRHLRHDETGATIVEFALVAPILLLMMFATMDLAHSQYLRTVLEGELQSAARESSMEAGKSKAMLDSLDKKVRDQLRKLSKTSTVTFERMAYLNYKQVEQRKEDFTDTNGNGKCDNGEPFTDTNNNASWDYESGMAGQGTSEQTVMYTATAKVPRVFPMYGLLGWSKEMEIKATTVLKNQPYGSQTKAGAGTCA